jgi:hypothetical protein
VTGTREATGLLELGLLSVDRRPALHGSVRSPSQRLDVEHLDGAAQRSGQFFRCAVSDDDDAGAGLRCRPLASHPANARRIEATTLGISGPSPTRL